MRELKFRIMYKNCTGTWIKNEYGLSDLVKMDGDGFLDDDDIIEQYTGLKDKNGKEIYEGDIVEYVAFYYGNEKRHRKVIEWEEWDSDDFGEPHNLGYFNLSEGVEVIGNIHENPDLLGGK